MIRKLVCIVCPVGCRLEAEKVGGEWKITGNACPRGPVYAVSELTDPRRLVTAVVATDSAAMPFVPVRTDRPLPRRMVAPLLNRLYRMRVRTPVGRGETLIGDVEASGVAVIFSADCPG